MKSLFSKLFSKKESSEVNPDELADSSASKNEGKRVGNIKVTAYFCVSQATAEKKVEILSKENMGSLFLAVDPRDTDADIIWRAIKGVTKELLESYLKARGLKQFIPYHRPTYDWQGKVLEAGSEMEIYYYHGKDFYEQKFKAYDQDYVMQTQDAIVSAKLEDLCKFYNLDPVNYL